MYSVNDGAVMAAWATQQKIAGTFVTFFGDPHSHLTRSMGVVLEHPGAIGVGLINRCKRSAMLFSKGVAKYVAVAELGNPDKPDEETYAEAVLKFIDSHGTEL